MTIIKFLHLVCLSVLMTFLFPEFVNAYKKLTDKGYSMFANFTDAENVVVMDYLRPMLIPRSSGTANNKKVQEFIISHYKGLGWHIEEDTFSDITPIGEVEFNNIIVTKNINSTRRLVLAAHYDSKYFTTQPEDQFVGATDSALPCALLIDLAHKMDPYLNKNDTVDSTTIQMIFFDGEEAFKTWTSTDSLYGSRHLAAKWETEIVNMTQSFHYKADSMLDGIDAFILLDLLGAKGPNIVNFFQTTSWMFKEMVNIEENLHQLNLLSKVENMHIGHDHPTTTVNTDDDTDDEDFQEISMFDESSLTTYQTHIEDDHIPFLQRGVPVLHLISYPFPSVWHSLADNLTAIDPGTVYNLNSVLRIFLLEYFEIDASKYVDIGG